MNSAQESKNELEAAIRYAENAISSAKQTIESMTFRQEMAQKNYQEQTGREQALQAEADELRDIIDRMGDDSKGDSVTINQLRRDLTVKTSQAEAWRKEYEECKAQVKLLEERIMDMGSDMVGDANTIKELNERNDSLVATIQRLKAEVNALEQPEQPTMPVIPKAVAIAIFREGMAYGAGNVCDELDNAPEVCIEETEYCGGFEVSFTQDIDLCDHLDTDYLRSKAVDNSDEEWVVDCLKNLCADKEFECRIHGVDDQEEKKND